MVTYKHKNLDTTIIARSKIQLVPTR